MNKVEFFIIPLLFLQGCITSRHDVRVMCNDDLRNSTILVAEIQGVSTSQSERLYNVIRNELSEEGPKVLYYPREEWNLASKGISRTDTAFVAKLKAQNIPFVLIVDVVDRFSGPTADYITPMQVRSRFGPQAHDHVPPAPSSNYKSVSILISIVSTKTQKPVYKSVTRTNINPIAIRERNEGEYQVNAGSMGLALQKAVKKGTRNLQRKCLSSP